MASTLPIGATSTASDMLLDTWPSSAPSNDAPFVSEHSELQELLTSM